MSPSHFGRAKEILQASSLLSSIGVGQNVGFTLPVKCPVKSFPECSLLAENEAEDMDVDSNEAPHLVPISQKLQGRTKEAQLRWSLMSGGAPESRGRRMDSRTQSAMIKSSLDVIPSHLFFL